MPQKKDRWGKRFGFVKFLEVAKEEELCSRLKDVWWGNTKLKVNRARFRRDEKVYGGSEKDGGGGKQVVATGISVGSASKRVEGLSYLAAVGGKIDSAPAQVPCLDLLPCSEMLEVLNGSFVGFLRQHRDARLLQHCFVMEGLEGISVSDMGVQMVLLQSENSGDIAKAREEHKVWWDGLFVDIKPWTPNLVSKKRVVWLRVLGIPLHFWEESVFKKIGAVFGEFLDFDEGTISRKRLDAAFIKVVTEKRSFINDFMKLRVVGAEFGLWVTEVGALQGSGKEVVERRWEADSSGDSRREGVVGSEFNETEEEEPLPAVFVREESVRGQEEGEQNLLLSDQPIGPFLRKDVTSPPLDVCHVDVGGREIRED